MKIDRAGERKLNVKECAIVTGATSGIGLHITLHLLKKGYRVYGFGRDFEKNRDMFSYYVNDENWIPVAMDLKKIEDLKKRVKEILKSENIKILVNAAGVGYFGPHEEINPVKLHEMVMINVEIPMVLTQICMRDLKKNQGYIINVSSITAKGKNTYGCAYGATKAALTSFGNSLFEESRKYGVKITTIHPDMTESDFYRNADFTTAENEDAYLIPQEVAECVDFILSQRSGVAVPDITIRPQKHQILKK